MAALRDKVGNAVGKHLNGTRIGAIDPDDGGGGGGKGLRHARFTPNFGRSILGNIEADRSDEQLIK